MRTVTNRLENVMQKHMQNWVMFWCAFALLPIGVGCPAQPQPDFPVDDDAILEPETVEISFDGNVPLFETELLKGSDGTEMEQPLTTVFQPLNGEQARSIPYIEEGLKTANTMLIPGLKLLATVTEPPPSFVSDEVRIWETVVNSHTITFFLRKDAQTERKYNYNLYAGLTTSSRGADRLILEGFFIPGPRTPEGRQTGTGILNYDYNNIGSLSGRGSVGFRVTPTKRILSVFLKDFRAFPRGNVTSARYKFRLGDANEGSFSFLIRSSALEDADIASVCESAVWNASLRGRANAKIRLTSLLMPNEFQLEECWDANLNQVWTEWSPFAPSNDAEDGAIQACGPFELTAPVEPDCEPPGDDERPTVPSESE